MVKCFNLMLKYLLGLILNFFYKFVALFSVMKIFIIEDDDIYAEFLKKSLRRKYKIHSFTNAEECLVALKSIQPDIFIIDYKLPGMTGMELYEKIKAYTDSEPKVIMLSGIDDGSLVLEFIRKGIRNYVEKDEKVIDSLVSIIEGKDDYFLP